MAPTPPPLLPSGDPDPSLPAPAAPPGAGSRRPAPATGPTIPVWGAPGRAGGTAPPAACARLPVTPEDGGPVCPLCGVRHALEPARPPASTGTAVVPAIALTAHQVTLFTGLSAGMTEAAMARHLGISRRTVERGVGTLLRQCGASSLFVLGMWARELGFLPGADPPPAAGKQRRKCRKSAT